MLNFRQGRGLVALSLVFMLLGAIPPAASGDELAADLDQAVGDIRAAKSDGALDAASLGLGQAARDRCVVNDAHSVEPNLPVRCGKVATASQAVRRTPPADGFGLLLHVGSGGEDDCDRSALGGRPAAGR